MLDAGGEQPERRCCSADGATYDFVSFCKTWLCKLATEDEVVTRWEECSVVVPRPLPWQRRRVLVLLRHGSRPDRGADPSLDSLGFKQAEQAASYLAGALTEDPPVVLFSSPFLRTLQTAQPVAKALKLPIKVEWGFGELLAKGWLHWQDPLPEIRARGFDQLAMSQHLDKGYVTAEMPVWPDMEGEARPGDQRQRERPLQRHRRAVEAALRAAGAGHALVVCHGSTHDFAVAALCPEWHPVERQTPACVPHCGISMLVEQTPGGDWWPVCFGATPWREHPSAASAAASAAAVAAGGRGAAAGSPAAVAALPSGSGRGRGGPAGDGLPRFLARSLDPSLGAGRGATPALAVVGAARGAAGIAAFEYRPISERLGCVGGLGVPGSAAVRGYRGPAPAGAQRPAATALPPAATTPHTASRSKETAITSAPEVVAVALPRPAGLSPAMVPAAAAGGGEAAGTDRSRDGGGEHDEAAVSDDSSEVVDLCAECDQPASRQQAEDGNHYCGRCRTAWVNAPH